MPPREGASSVPGREWALAISSLQLVQREHPSLDLGDLNDLVARAAAAGPSQAPLEGCTLAFRHACRFSSCRDPACSLCKNIPHKACTDAQQLCPKYVVRQQLAAPCGGALRLALGGPCAAAQWAALRAAQACVRMLLVDERKRQEHAKRLLLQGASSASNAQVAALLAESVVAFDPAGQPMLLCKGQQAEPDGSLLLSLEDDVAAGVSLSGLSVGCSTERATAGRKRAPVRLAAVLVDATGAPLDAAPLLSPEFYVVSDRAENHEGMGAPLLMDSPVSQVRTIGKETVRRLKNILESCELVGVELPLPEGLACVTTVRQLARLLQDMRSHSAELSQVLRLSKAQLEAALAHVSTAVEPDTALRAFLAPNSTGLVYTCEQGGCTCADPAAVIKYRRDSSGALLPLALQRVDMAMPPSARPTALQQLVAQAQVGWATPGHPGWQVFDLGGRRFQSFDQLRRALPADVLQPVIPQLPQLEQAQQATVVVETVAQVALASAEQPPPQADPEPPRRRRRARKQEPEAAHQERDGEAAASRPQQQAVQQAFAAGHVQSVASPPPLQSVWLQAAGAAYTITAAQTTPSPLPSTQPPLSSNPFAVARSGASNSSGVGKRQRWSSSGELAGCASAAKLQRLSPAEADAALGSGHGSDVEATLASIDLQQLQQLVRHPQTGQSQQQGLELCQQARMGLASPQAQQERPMRPMPSVPRPQCEQHAPQAEQQLQGELLHLLKHLSWMQQQCALDGWGCGDGDAPVGATAAASLVQRLSGLGADGGSDAPDFWTSSLEHLAEMFLKDTDVPLMPLPMPSIP